MSDNRAEATRIETQFAGRIDKIRARFALTLAGKIERTDAALSRMAGDGGDAVDAVAIAYRWFHDVSGTAPVLGFEATGCEARNCAAILIGPFRGGRGLSAEELVSLTSTLEALRIAALREVHSTESNQRSAP